MPSFVFKSIQMKTFGMSVQGYKINYRKFVPGKI
jgi:hypothetical protein